MALFAIAVALFLYSSIRAFLSWLKVRRMSKLIEEMEREVEICTNALAARDVDRHNLHDARFWEISEAFERDFGDK